jgi:hypothetical protein
MTGAYEEPVMARSLLDEAIVGVYKSFNTPADQIVTDPAIGQMFAD